jgi:flagellar basal-body rod protein FlgC
MDFDRAASISAAGMQAQSTRLRVIAENVANADTTGQSPGADPYRRKTVTFSNRLDRELGTRTVQVARVGRTEGEFPTRYDPNHPAANADGYVKTPNVNSFLEMMDMREAQRTYSANLSVLQASNNMSQRVIDALR